jgi:hypothetical protein
MIRRTIIAAVLALVLGSCSRHHPMAPVAAPDPRPIADSPANAVRRFAWGWANRDTIAAAGGMTTDFVFSIAVSDSAGIAWRDRPWGTGEERRCVRHLFVGGGNLPHASAIQLMLDPTLVPLNDPRPGFDPRWHKTILTRIDLKVTVIDAYGAASVAPVVGSALFYLVRGDSALAQAGCPRDSLHWYVMGWEDQTISAGAPGYHTDPTPAHTWASLKALYLP